MDGTLQLYCPLLIDKLSTKKAIGTKRSLSPVWEEPHTRRQSVTNAIVPQAAKQVKQNVYIHIRRGCFCLTCLVRFASLYTPRRASQAFRPIKSTFFRKTVVLTFCSVLSSQRGCTTDALGRSFVHPCGEQSSRPLLFSLIRRQSSVVYRHPSSVCCLSVVCRLPSVCSRWRSVSRGGLEWSIGLFIEAVVVICGG